jgi:hypothetical protein
MKRYIGVLVVLGIFGVGYLFGACSGINYGGKGVKVQTTALAQAISVTSGAGSIEPKWYDDFDAKVADQRELDKVTNAYVENAHAVPLCWLLKIVLRNMDKDEENMIFVVTDVDGNVMSPKEYKIFIRGYKESRDISWAEDFPPVFYP